MDKIGIMQGRIIPERLDKFQTFPISAWEEELSNIKKIGFKYVELLYDKDLAFKKLLLNPQNADKFGINPKGNTPGPIVNSMCVDYLASTSVINAKRSFYIELTNIIELVKNTVIKTLVIPFFDENFLNSREEFEVALDWFKTCKLDDFASTNNVLLALELNLPSYQIRSVLEKYQFKNIKICYDVGNAKAMGYSPEDEITELGDFIHHLHIKDRKINGPNVMLGEGDVNFKACFKALKTTGYNGTMILETMYDNSPATDAAKNLQFVRNLLMEV